MKVLVLTTETLHHAHFVRELANAGHSTFAIAETGAVKASFPTAHPFEEERERLERDKWFGGKSAQIRDFSETAVVESINSEESSAFVRKFQPKVTVVFGTRKIGASVMAAAPKEFWNLHGGNPEKYRGLDTHLWAVYHREFGELSTCLHYLSEELDRGDIISLTPIPLSKGMKLAELRAANTEVCVSMVNRALSDLQEGTTIARKPQASAGRYYSFMPAVLKDLCVKRFEAHTREGA